MNSSNAYQSKSTLYDAYMARQRQRMIEDAHRKLILNMQLQAVRNAQQCSVVIDLTDDEDA